MNVSAWRYYIQFYKDSYHLLLLSIVASIGQSVLLFPIALLVRYVFDVIIPTSNYSRLVLIGVAILGLYLTNMGLALWTRYIVLKITKVAIQRLRVEILKKFYAFSRSYYSQADRSQLHTSIVEDTRRLDVMSNAVVAQVIPALLICAALSAVLIAFNWFLFLVSASIAPLIYLSTITLGKRVKHWTKAYQQNFQMFSKGMLFVLQTMELTRIQAAEDYEMGRQGKLLNDDRLISSKMSFLITTYSLLQSLISAFSGVLLLIVGGIAVGTGDMTLGEILSFYVAVALMKNYLNTMLQALPQIIEGNESVTTLYNLIQLNYKSPYSGTKEIIFQGNITLENVTFRYGEKLILENITLSIKPKETIALVGANGAGKSTIAYLILGFYQPLKGQLYADEHPFSTLDIAHLRRQIGVVMQEPVIFAGTIFENITYGSTVPCWEKVVEAAKLATAHDFIDRLPDGYDTFVGEGGMLLSGGQRQRIAIARALLRQPKLLILDEPTNHLDSASVYALMENLKKLADAPAILIISHNMEVVREAEYVLALKDGCLVPNY